MIKYYFCTMKQNIVALDLSFSLDLHCHQQSISPLSSTTKNMNEPRGSPVEVDRPGLEKRLEMRDVGVQVITRDEFIRMIHLQIHRLVGGFNPSEKYDVVKVDHFPKYG